MSLDSAKRNSGNYCPGVWYYLVEGEMYGAGNMSFQEYNMHNQALQVLWFVVIGVVASWLAGRVMAGKGFGTLGNLIIGVLGAVLGGWLFSLAGLFAGKELLGSLVAAAVASLVVLFFCTRIRRA